MPNVTAVNVAVGEMLELMVGWWEGRRAQSSVFVGRLGQRSPVFCSIFVVSFGQVVDGIQPELERGDNCWSLNSLSETKVLLAPAVSQVESL